MADDASRGTSCNQRQRPCTQVAVALPAGGSLRGRGMVRGEGGVRPSPGGRQRCQVRDGIAMEPSWAGLLTMKFEGREAPEVSLPHQTLSIYFRGWW